MTEHASPVRDRMRRRVWPLMASLCLASGAWLAASKNPPEAGAAPHLRVLTYNIHHGEGMDGRFDLPRLAAVVNGSEPDIVALQEVDRGTARSGRVDQLAELARMTGMVPAFGKAMDYQGGEYGVAVLSRRPILRSQVHALPASPDREPRAALTVQIELAPRGLRVNFTSTHLDYGRDMMDQVAQASYIAAALSGGDRDLGILAGDMNTRPDTETMQILTRRWTDVFIEPPVVDAIRPRRRIDYVMVRPAASWRTVASQFVDGSVASDHQPLLAVLECVGTSPHRIAP